MSPQISQYIYVEANVSAGAFTPGCQARHLPPYIEKLDELKGKGVDIVAVIAFNDAWVMNAWGKVNGVKEDGIVRKMRRPGIRDAC